ncbi:hypothetical protein E2562_011762 [Oryza meyeriana var. granulata]|uniref:DUF834 domain-containing protein n=1 Tax=Oryza meyeriana var. granulata TaxID=110450 RepID=A0A6G1CQI8_9ORYZ|nr:hypothetical protein E2562_011762 [Oryza meyeriana var. granulata]
MARLRLLIGKLLSPVLGKKAGEGEITGSKRSSTPLLVCPHLRIRLCGMRGIRDARRARFGERCAEIGVDSGRGMRKRRGGAVRFIGRPCGIERLARRRGSAFVALASRRSHEGTERGARAGHSEAMRVGVLAPMGERAWCVHGACVRL